jgi:hypothetical protein
MYKLEVQPFLWFFKTGCMKIFITRLFPLDNNFMYSGAIALAIEFRLKWTVSKIP